MHKLTLSPFFDIQLFGEGAGGGDGGTGAGAATGQTAAAAPAQPQTPGAKHNPLADVKYGKQDAAPAAGEPQQISTDDRAAKFEELIRGEYKDLYDARIQDTIQKRLKGNEGIVQRYNALLPSLDLLAEKYGVDVNDAAALARAIEGDTSMYEEEALEKGLTVESLMQTKRMERENKILKQMLDDKKNEEKARAQYAALMQQSEQVKAIYPGFDIQTEMQNEEFRNLLNSGVPLRTAFEVIHKDEIIPAAMHYTAKQVTEKVANSVRAGQKRPAEGAMRSQSATTFKSDVSQLTRADRDEIDRRVARGEKIRF